jgi:pilus assembly protein Flp/PilA
MQGLTRLLVSFRLWKDQRGQDLIEYAMIAGFIAVVSGVFMPAVTQDISTVFSKIASTMASAASTS